MEKIIVLGTGTAAAFENFNICSIFNYIYRKFN